MLDIGNVLANLLCSRKIKLKCYGERFEIMDQVFPYSAVLIKVMNKYYIYYRQQQQQEILCYSDKEAIGKAIVWYDKKCTDKNKNISNVQVKTPKGVMLPVRR